MTQIDKQAVERLSNFLHGAAPNADGDWWEDVAAREKGNFWWRRYLREIERLHYAALDAAEAEKRAAVAAERERCAKIADERALMLEAYASFGEKEREFLLMAKGARDAAKFIRETKDG
jgi:hypothetical protein